MINGREYRLATYRKARIVSFTKNGIAIKQGKYEFTAEVLDDCKGMKLKAPTKGKMSRTIEESLQRKLRYKFTNGNETLFDITTNRACYEFSEIPK